MATPADFTGLRFESPDPDPAPQPKESADSKPQVPPEKDDSKDDRYEALLREADELRSSNRQLVELVGRQTPARKNDKAAPTEDFAIDWGKDDAPESDDEPEDPATLVEDLSKLGRDALAKRGFVRKSDVVKIAREESRKAAVAAATQVVGHTRGQMTNEAAIMREFPDLGDPDSDLFKATAAHVNAAVRLDANAAKSPTTLYLAAKAAQAEIEAKGGNRGGKRTGTEKDVDDPENDDREPVRRAPDRKTQRDVHVAAQQGDRGRGRSRVTTDDDDFTMDADAKQVARLMGISDDEYKTEATRVRKAAAPARRRG